MKRYWMVVLLLAGIASVLILPANGQGQKARDPAWDALQARKPTFSLGQCLATGQGTSYLWGGRGGGVGDRQSPPWRAEQCARAEEDYQRRLRSWEDDVLRYQERINQQRQKEGRVEEGLREPPPAPPLPTITVPPPPAPPVVVRTQPRLTDDRQTVILLEEIREPQQKRRPEISLRTDASGVQQVSISGQGIRPLPAIDLRCGDTVRSLLLSGFSEGPDRNVGVYSVSKEIVETILSAPTCHLAVAGALLPIPRELVSVVWGKASGER